MNQITRLLILLGILVFVWVPTRVYAHVLEADRDIGAILHIYPDDNLISGREVRYLLSFQDVNKRFTLQQCDCSVSYKANGEVIATKTLQNSSTLDSVNYFTFPEPGVYSIEVSGMPKDVGQFQPFELVFTKRVASGDIEAQGMPLLLLGGITGAVGIIMLAAYASDLPTRDEKLKKKKTTSSQ